MPNTSRVVLNEIDQSFAPANVTSGISGLSGVMKRGPIGDPKDIITSPEMLQRIYGGLDPNNDFPLLCQRAIERGSALRINNIRHYNDVNDKTSVSATLATEAASVLITLSAALAAGHTMQATINGTAVTQAFSVNSLNTLQAFATKVKGTAALVPIVEDIFPYDGQNLIIIPKAGVVLTVTSVPTGTGAPTSTVDSANRFEDASGNALFRIEPKYKGAGYNTMVVFLTRAASGDTNAFDLVIRMIGEDYATEVYSNKKIIGKPTAATANFLQEIIDKSYIATPVYLDLSALPGTQLVPRQFAIRYDSATDGGAVTDTDYNGSSAGKTGWYAFDAYNDMYQVGAPNVSTVAVAQGVSNYASTRKDLVGIAWLGDPATESALATARDNTLVDSSYAAVVGGGLIIVSPFNSQDKNISVMGDFFGILNFTETNFKPWISPVGKQRGKLTNAKGIPNNFGAPGNYANLNMLANRQIILPVNDGGSLYMKHNFTAQLATSKLSFLNIRKMLIYLKKSLGPLLENYLEEPNDPFSWRQMYLQGSPLLINLVDQRALYDWDWQGDQFADKIPDDLVINTPQDLDAGRYKIKLYVKPINSIQEIIVDIIITPSGVSFEDNLDTITSTN